MSAAQLNTEDYTQALLLIEGATDGFSLDEVIEKTGWTHKKANECLSDLNLKRRIQPERVAVKGKRVTKYKLRRN